MKQRIRTGQYNFSGPEWDRVSEAGLYLVHNRIFNSIKIIAKDLIRRCLITDPDQRANIAQLMGHKWIQHYNKNPTTPLLTTQLLNDKEQAVNWPEFSVSLERGFQKSLDLFLIGL